MKSYSYECYSCNQRVNITFFLCSNCHVSCNSCQRVDINPVGANECPVCGIKNVQCLSSAVFRKNKQILSGSQIGVPTLILPCPQLISSAASDNTFSRNNVVQCPDCQKYVLLTHMLEHYGNDHKSITIAPIFPGAIISFRFTPGVLEEDCLKRLQLFLMIDVADDSDFSSDVQETYYGGEKLFFLAGTKFANKGAHNENLIALWLSASFHATSTVFSLEVTSCFNTAVSTMVTGFPIDLTSNDIFKRQSRWSGLDYESAVALKESTFETLERHGGCIINISIQDSLNEASGV